MFENLAREKARAEVSKKLEDFLKAEYPSLVKIVGGYGFYTSYIDEETQKPVPVTVDIIVPRLIATTRAKAFNLEEAAEEYNSRPGRRTADPVAAQKRRQAKEETATRISTYTKVLREWIETHDVQKMSAKDIWNAVPELQTMPMMQIGQYLKKLYEDPIQPLLDVELDSVTRKKVYSKIER